MTSDLFFFLGCLSLRLIGGHPPYLRAWLGGQNCTNTRPHPDRSDTVGILPAVKPNPKASSPNITARNMVSKKHSMLLRSPAGKTHSFVFCQKIVCSALKYFLHMICRPKNKKSFHKPHEKRDQGDQRNTDLTAPQTSHWRLHEKETRQVKWAQSRNTPRSLLLLVNVNSDSLWNKKTNQWKQYPNSQDQLKTWPCLRQLRFKITCNSMNYGAARYIALKSSKHLSELLTVGETRCLSHRQRQQSKEHPCFLSSVCFERSEFRPLTGTSLSSG